MKRLFTLLACTLALDAAAWGADGHSIIAELASRRLTPDARQEVERLLGEYKGVGAKPGANAMSMLDLGNPDLDWVKLANAMGVEAARATTLEQCADLMAQSFSSSSPFLVDLMI